VFDFSATPTVHYAKANNPGAGDAFGTALALTDQMLAVGAPLEDSSTTGWNPGYDESALDSGAVYSFR
jgi:hypothetical protein